MISVPGRKALPLAGPGAAFLCAALLWAGLPGGGGVWPVLFIALVPLFFLARAEATSRKRFLYGLVAGLCHFIIQLYWIVLVLGRYGGLPWFFSYPAMVLLALYMALYVAVFVVVAGMMLRRWKTTTVLWTVPALWVGLDWVRSLLFSGFPWMDLGYGMWQTPLLLQSADVFGHHFLTYLIVFVNIAIFFLVSQCERQNGPCRRPFIAVTTVVLLAVVAVYGGYRSTSLEKIISKEEKIAVGIVQGNIDQSEKWAPALQQRTMDIYLGRSQELLHKPPVPDLIVWPETALPFFPSQSELFGAVPRLAHKYDAAVLTGSPWFEVVDAEKGLFDMYNSAFVISPSGEYSGRYSKSHLVPFGEYVPLKHLLFFLAPLVEAVGDFTPGKIEKPLEAQKARCGILICYESIFPAIARKWVDNGANLLVNLTNDAWYGRSSAPYQSMAMSVLRAVESRRSLVRAANTGISGFVDPLGRVKVSSAIFVDWAESRKVALLQHRSFYSRHGYFFGPVCFLLAVVMFGCLLYAGTKYKKSTH